MKVRFTTEKSYLRTYRDVFPELFVLTISLGGTPSCFKSILWRTRKPATYYQRFPIFIMYTLFHPEGIIMAPYQLRVCTYFINPNPTYDLHSLPSHFTEQRDVYTEELLGKDLLL